MKIAFHTLGCKVNMYETETLKRLYISQGYEVTDFNEKADIYLINTCSVTAVADKKSRQMISRAKSKNPDAQVIVTGCFVQGMSEEEKAALNVSRVIDNVEKNKLLAEAELLTPIVEGSRVRADIKIEDGCNSFCTYCIIPYKRGRIECRSIESIIDEVKALANAGHREIVLTGIHISSYGSENLLKLISEVAAVEGVDRVRLGSLEPRIITKDFLDRLKEIPQFCPHFHLSLQSGCDKTLKAMNRHYTADEYRQGVKLIRSVFEHPAITTDVIVGFPGETEEDFEKSKQFVDEMQFYHMHIFPYSRREGTIAARMEGQLTNAEKSRRVGILEEIDKKNSKLFEDYYTGRKVTILTEEIVNNDGMKYIVGHTETYVKGYVPADGLDINQMVLCEVSEDGWKVV